MMTFQKLVSALAKTPALHARFINTLSLLEYIGARKILKSQKEEDVSAKVLSHAAEEIRHAFTLKKVALKMSNGLLTTYSDEFLLCGEEARRYIQNIDRSAEIALDQKLPTETQYLITTLLLEKRAQKIYPAYEEVLAQAGFQGVMKGIVKDEDRHLASVTQDLIQKNEILESQLDKMELIENAEFARFIQAIEDFVFPQSGRSIDI